MGINYLSKQADKKRVYIPDTDWHYIGDVGEPAWTSGWGNYGGSYEDVAYRIDAEGWVHLKGVADRSSGSSIYPFTLPEGYRPPTAGAGSGNSWYTTTARMPTSVGTNFPNSIEVTRYGVVGVLTFSSLYFERVIFDGVKFPVWEQPYGNNMVFGTGTAALAPATYGNADATWHQVLNVDSGWDTFYLGGQAVAASTPYVFTWEDNAPATSQMFPLYDHLTAEQCDYISVGIEDPIYTTGAQITPRVNVPILSEKALGSCYTDVSDSLSNSWVRYGKDTVNDWTRVGYGKDKHGFVHLHGLVKSGSSASAVIYTLPTGYRPAYDVYHAGISFDSATAVVPVTIIKVATNGDISAFYGGNTANYTSISGVSFYVG